MKYAAALLALAACAMAVPLATPAASSFTPAQPQATLPPQASAVPSLSALPSGAGSGLASPIGGLASPAGGLPGLNSLPGLSTLPLSGAGGLPVKLPKRVDQSTPALPDVKVSHRLSWLS